MSKNYFLLLSLSLYLFFSPCISLSLCLNLYHSGGFQISPVLYENWLFPTIFLFPPKTKREEEKENEVAKPVFKKISSSISHTKNSLTPGFRNYGILAIYL